MKPLFLNKDIVTIASAGPSIIVIKQKYLGISGCPCAVINVEDDTFYPFYTIDLPLTFNPYDEIPVDYRESMFAMIAHMASNRLIKSINSYFKYF